MQLYKYRPFCTLSRTFDTRCVSGENGFSNRAGVTQLVECDLAKVDVAGSNPVSRSIKNSEIPAKNPANLTGFPVYTPGIMEKPWPSFMRELPVLPTRHGSQFSTPPNWLP